MHRLSVVVNGVVWRSSPTLNAGMQQASIRLASRYEPVVDPFFVF